MSQYDDLCCNKMENALAELLGISIDTIDMLGLTIEPDVGYDDFFYGYYVEFPTKESIDECILSQIEKSDINKIPWGKTENYSEAEFSNTSVDPFGYQAEWEQEEFLAHLPSKENVIETLQNIKIKINNDSNDDILIKSLIFSAFSITESYMRSLVWEKIPSFDFAELDNKLKTILKKELLFKLSQCNTRIKLYKELTGQKLKVIPYYQEVRNYLAHNMFLAKINNNKLIIKKQDDSGKEYSIELIIESLENYVNNPIE